MDSLRKVARPFNPGALIDICKEAGSARYVLLGEASHGTRDYYYWRARISQRLIEEKEFKFIAVEGDWPDCFKVNRYVKNYPDSGRNAEEVLRYFNRWPTWLWANWEMVEFIEWLRQFNLGKPEKEKIGFYGLDVYSLWDSLRIVVSYLEKTNPQLSQLARQAFACFEPFGPDFTVYAWANVAGYQTCEEEVLRLLNNLYKHIPLRNVCESEAEFNIWQNALVARDSEKYYRIMIKSDRHSWNLRDSHMNDTLERLMDYYGPQAKGIVWAHNTHVGDARATNMAIDKTINIGQLVRQNHRPEEVFIAGFGGFRGKVIAAASWGAPWQEMEVPGARPGSLEERLHVDLSGHNSWLFLRDLPEGHSLWQQLGHRAIGVVYHPEAETGNYVPTVLPLRYDAFIFLNLTGALQPLQLPERLEKDLPETYPKGE